MSDYPDPLSTANCPHDGLAKLQSSDSHQNPISNTKSGLSHVDPVPTSPAPSPIGSRSARHQTAVCVFCQGQAKSRCQGCSDVVVADKPCEPTWYCSTACQKDDWKSHKALCKQLQAHKQLYRAGDLVQTMHYMYREIAFDIEIKAIKEQGNEIHIWEGEHGRTQIMARFPKELVPSEAIKATVLSYLACEEAIAYMQALTKTALAGITASILEVQVNLKNHRRHVVFIRGNGEKQRPVNSHVLLCIALKDGTKYAYDLASAQYGYDDPVVIWGEFERERVEQIKSFNRFGMIKKQIEKNIVVNSDRSIAVKGGEFIRTAVSATHMRLVECFDYSVKEFLDVNQIKLKDILLSPQRRYEGLKSALVDYVRRELREYDDWANETRGGHFRIKTSK